MIREHESGWFVDQENYHFELHTSPSLMLIHQQTTQN